MRAWIKNWYPIHGDSDGASLSWGFAAFRTRPPINPERIVMSTWELLICRSHPFHQRAVGRVKPVLLEGYVMMIALHIKYLWRVGLGITIVGVYGVRSHEPWQTNASSEKKSEGKMFFHVTKSLNAAHQVAKQALN